jgi:hypothetical protein
MLMLLISSSKRTPLERMESNYGTVDYVIREKVRLEK